MTIALLIFFVFGITIQIYLPKILKQIFTNQVKWIIGNAREYALEQKLSKIDTRLFLYSICKNEIGIAFQLLGETTFKLKEFVSETEKEIKKSHAEFSEEVTLTEEAEKCLVDAILIGKRKKSRINSAHILLAIVTAESIISIQAKYNIPSGDMLSALVCTPEFVALKNFLQSWIE